MKETTYEDAQAVARFLDLNPEAVWRVIRGMKYGWISELKIAVLNSLSK